MLVKAFLMSIPANAETEYERRHMEIWPDMKELFRRHGVKEYYIFLLSGTGQLFAFALVENETQWTEIRHSPECIRWWNYMKDLMPLDNSGAPATKELKQVFHFIS